MVFLFISDRGLIYECLKALITWFYMCLCLELCYFEMCLCYRCLELKRAYWMLIRTLADLWMSKAEEEEWD